MPMQFSRPPPLLEAIVVTLAACAFVQLLAFLFRHGIAILAGGVLLCVFLKYLKDITN